MSAAVRLIRAEEYPEARRLWDICFPEDADAFSAYYFARRTKPEYVYAAFDGETMVSALHALPYPLAVSCGILPAAMVAGVGTLPKYRRRGLAGEVIRFTHGELIKKGAAAAVLKPDVDYYSRFGYVPLAFHNEYFLPASALPEGAGREALHAPTAVEMLSAYKAFVAPYVFPMARNIGDMEACLEESAATGGVAAAAGGAYALYDTGEEGFAVAGEVAGADVAPLLYALAAKHGGVRFRLPDGVAVPGAQFLGRKMFSMICPLGEWADGASERGRALSTLIFGSAGTCFTAEFC